MVTTLMVSMASRSRRRRITRSTLQVLTVWIAAASASPRTTNDRTLPPPLAKAGHCGQLSDTANPQATMASHRAPCQRLSTKSSSNAARAHNQNKAASEDTIGIDHHQDALGKNGAVTIA